MINIDPGYYLKFEFLNMPVCCPHIFVHQQTKDKRHNMKSPDPAFYKYPAAKYPVFKIRQDLCMLSDKRIDHTDQGEHIAGHSGVCKSKFCIHFCFPRPKRLQETSKFPYGLKKCAFVHLIPDERGQTLFFLSQ